MAAICLVVVAAGCGNRAEPPSVACGQIEVPNGGTFAMTFTITGRGAVPATELNFSIHDTGLYGEPIGPNSHYVLRGRFLPGVTVTLAQDVPAPPNFHMLKFSKLDCTLIRTRFENGSSL